MSSYLNRIQITIDEETDVALEELEAEGMVNDVDGEVPVEHVINITEVDVSIAEDERTIGAEVDAMNSANDVTTDLTEQVAVEEELLENPEDLTDQAAEITQDAFVISLAKLKFPKEEYNRYLTTMDNDYTPAERVAVTLDGVKDFLLRIKEHIIAFFRSIKEKLKRLYSKIWVFLANVGKRAEALQKKIRENANLKQGSFNDNDANNNKLYSFFPMGAIQKKNIDTIVEELGEGTPAIGMNEIKQIVNVIKNNAFSKKTSATINDINKIINSNAHPWASWFTNSGLLKKVERAGKGNSVNSHSVILRGAASNTIKAMRWYCAVGTTEVVPSVETYDIRIPSEYTRDRSAPKGLNGEKVIKYLDTVVKLSKGIKSFADNTYKQMEDINKSIVDELDKFKKSDTVKPHTVIKVSSVCRTMVANVAFNRVMDQSKAIRRLLAMCNFIVNNLK